MNQFMFTYYNQYSKVILIIEAANLASAIRIFLLRPTVNHINDAISFQVKKVVS